ncbi:MAG: hypothetical protein Q9186_001673 [Xanthomendoza sp. 1 TL-2023]
MHLPTDDGNQITIPLRPGPDHNESEPTLPAPPSPSADPGLVPQSTFPTQEAQDPTSFRLSSNDVDIFNISELAALKLLCGTVEALIKVTGDVPPTPPVSAGQPARPRIVSMGIENQPSHSRSNSADRRRSQPPTSSEWHSADTVPEKAKTPIGSPEARPTEPLQVASAGPEPLDIQQGAVVRKFYSKVPPPIPLEEYLLRLQKYCPMSTGVYLTASYHIYQLAVIQRSIPVTVRNAHRLLLGALRVAGKAVDDTNFRHKRFAHVGGVTEPELGRLEIAFCFLTKFDLRVTAEMLREHVKVARDTAHLHEKLSKFRPKIPPLFNNNTAAVQVNKEIAGTNTR